jgi:hypothetical protein
MLSHFQIHQITGLKLRNSSLPEVLWVGPLQQEDTSQKTKAFPLKPHRLSKHPFPSIGLEWYRQRLFLCLLLCVLIRNGKTALLINVAWLKSLSKCGI